MIIISHGFSFKPCLQQPCFPSVLCWGGEGTLAGKGNKDPTCKLAWENLNSRASPAPALQTETWSWRESEQGRSMRLTLLRKHPVQLIYYFEVIWYNPDAIELSAMSLCQLFGRWTFISRSLKGDPLNIKYTGNNAHNCFLTVNMINRLLKLNVTTTEPIVCLSSAVIIMKSCLSRARG